MADEDLDWTPADEARDRIDRLDEAKAEWQFIKHNNERQRLICNQLFTDINYIYDQVSKKGHQMIMEKYSEK